MKKSTLLIELFDVANQCDQRGLFKEADIVTNLGRRIAQFDEDFGGYERDDDYNVWEENQLLRDEQMDRDSVYGYHSYNDYDTARDIADDYDESVGVNIVYDRTNFMYYVIPDNGLEEFMSHFADGDLSVVDHFDPVQTDSSHYNESEY